MTHADMTRAYVNRILAEDRRNLSLSEIFFYARPVRLDARGEDEAAFVYRDGSEFVVEIDSDCEQREFEGLRRHLRR